MVPFTNLLAFALAVAVLPQFVAYSSGSIPLQLAELGVVFLMIGLGGTLALTGTKS
jgi:threonine/homoserine/homoserine lactone efflux protein